MAVFDKFNANSEIDASLPDFTVEELEAAAELRQRVTPAPGLARRDHCPHTPACRNVGDCIEAIAWYRRHQRAIEADL